MVSAQLGKGRVAATVCAAGLVLVTGSAAYATTGSGTSAPNGELTASSSLFASTDHDRDGDANTAQAGDRLQATSSVRNNAGTPLLVTIKYSLDAPGTDYDTTQTEQVNLGPGDTVAHAATFPLVGRAPAGDYTYTTTATATETASASGSITVR